MKLIGYHIENYGKIKEEDGSFDGGLTCVCEKNGYGKTTLASFIKAMFYGLPKVTKATKEFNDRKHFYPFGGGKFGGTLTFEWQGATYRIERYFDQTSETKDELTVYCNGAPYEGFGKDIGKTVFKVDEESFRKTVFITADEVDICSTQSISEKLNHSLETSGDIDFEKASEILEKAKKRLKAGRGTNDEINRTNAEIKELETRIRNLKDMDESLSGAYADRESLTKEIDRLQEALEKERSKGIVLQKWETFDEKSRQAQETEQKLASLEEKYPQGMPSEEERKTLADASGEAERLKSALSVTAFGEVKEGKLTALQSKFSQGLPTDEALEAMQEKIRAADRLAEQAERGNYELSAQEQRIVDKFSFSKPSEEELSACRELTEEYKKKDAKAKALATAAQTAQPQTPKKSGKSAGILFAVAAILCALGVALLFVQQIAGIIALAVGAAVFVGAIFTSKKSVNAPLPPSNVNMELISLQGEMRHLEEQIHSFTAKYGYYSTLGTVYDFGELERDISAYSDCLARMETKKAEREEACKKKEALTAGISVFLTAYGENEEDAQSGLTNIRLAMESYRGLLAEKERTGKDEAASRGKLDSLEKTVSAILEKYGLSADARTIGGLSELNGDCESYVSWKKELEILRTELAKYKAQNGLDERPQEAGADIDELNKQLSSLRRNLAEREKEIADVERETERLTELEEELASKEEYLKECKERYDLLADTSTALGDANKALKRKYIEPIQDRFSAYADALEKALGEKIEMDQDFRIVFMRSGQSRSERHLSAGERSLCALCLRFAMIDNLYEDETPFIVMDDPFVHLDETHLERTAQLLKELAKGKQLIYFCCHSSRKVE